MAADDPLKTELVLLSQEIHSTLTPSSDDEDNTTMTNLINDLPVPTLNDPKELEIDEDNTEVSQHATAQVFLDRVREILEGSGIELVLPVDCGRVSPSVYLELSEVPLGINVVCVRFLKNRFTV